MTEINDIADRMFEATGRIRTGNGTNVLSVFYPYVILDLQKQLFDKYIAPLDLKFKIKKVRNKWNDNYNTFNQDFFKMFKDEQQDRVIDIMDEFYDAVSPSLEAILDGFRRMCSMENEHTQNVIAASMTCAIIAHFTLDFWKNTYKRYKRLKDGITRIIVPETNKNIETIEHCAYQFSNLYEIRTSSIDCNTPEMASLADDLYLAMLNFFNSYTPKKKQLCQDQEDIA